MRILSGFSLMAVFGQKRTSEGATSSEGSAPAFNPIAQWEYATKPGATYCCGHVPVDCTM